MADAYSTEPLSLGTQAPSQKAGSIADLAQAQSPVSTTPKVVADTVDFYYGTFHALKNINLVVPRPSGNGADWAFGVRQVHISADSEPHERPH